MKIDVRHNEPQSRFEATVDGHLCVADYHLAGNVMVMPHTYVPPPVEGRGIAAELVAAALAYARDKKLRVDPRCSYVRTYMRRHPETQALHV
ncbi:MAG: GNAT family N-acetyltransferase [Rhizobacter sp.]